jgi:hypothetical protein
MGILAMIDPKNFKPLVLGKSDKYSWRIFRFLRKYGRFGLRVYRVGWCPLDGIVPSDRGHLMFVLDDGDGWPITAGVIRVTVVGNDACGCVINWSGKNWNQLEKEDVTDWFFREYARIGRCLFQPEWSHNFVKINRNSRKCRHCGEIHRRTVVTKKIIKRVDQWAAE